MQEKEINTQLAGDSTQREAKEVYSFNNFIEKLGVYYNVILKDGTNKAIAIFFASLIMVVELIVILLKYTSGVGGYEKALAEEQYERAREQNVTKIMRDMEKEVDRYHYDFTTDVNGELESDAAKEYLVPPY